MAPVLKLHQGDAVAEYQEHPTEVARRALMAAADVEVGWVADECQRFARALPARDARRDKIRINNEEA